MYTQQDIEKQLVEEIVARNDTLTFFGVGGVIRGFITAVAIKLRELWYDYTQLKRKLFINTCSGADLEVYAEERGLTRKGSNPAGALVLFKGVSGTVIPLGTIITDPTSKRTYETKQQIELGSLNNDFVYDGNINVDSTNIGDVCWAECINSGKTGNAPSHAITQISVPGVSAVMNPSPAQMGRDEEPDDEFRYRIKNYVKLLNHNTQKYYEAVCQDLDDNILRTLAHKDYSKPDSITITIVTKSGVPLTASELILLAGQIYDAQQSFTEITCKNIAFTLISVSERVNLKGINGLAVDNDKYFVETANYLANYFDWSKWEWGQNISTDDVFLICQSVPQTDDIQLSSFRINDSDAVEIEIPSNSLPYFSSLSVTDITGDTPVEKSSTNITQSFSNIKLPTKEL